jgi:DNA-binding MurR/RpiR family transcriptional regulator
VTEDLSLPERIQHRLASLSTKQRRVAEILAGDPSAIALSSVHEVAHEAGVDAATVVRTCQRLGYTGWRELLASVRGDVARRRTFAERTADLEGQHGDLTGLIHENARRNVDDTFDGLDPEALDAVAAVLAAADSVLVTAGGVSHGAGEYLTSSLQIIGVRAALVSGISDAAPVLATLGPRDAVIGLSMWRYLKSTVDILERAQRQLGATTVVLTDSAVSSATRFADHRLVAAATTVGPRLSMTGVIALIEALVARTALVDPRRSQGAAALASDVYFDGHVLGDPAPGAAEGGPSAWEARLAEEIDHE